MNITAYSVSIKPGWGSPRPRPEAAGRQPRCVVGRTSPCGGCVQRGVTDASLYDEWVRPYAVGPRRGSFEETTDIVRTVVVTAAGLVVWALNADPQVVPRSVPVVAAALALVGMFAVRLLMPT